MRRLNWDSEFWGIEIFTLDEDNIFSDLKKLNSVVNDLDKFLVQALV